jgi:hypothetical protein
MSAPDARPRELSADLYRVVAAMFVVMGHWLAASVVFHDGRFARQNVLVDLPWTQWLTWVFQVVPVFFLVAGYASAVSWSDRRAPTGGEWLRMRLRRTLGPTGSYVAVVCLVVAALLAAGVDGSQVAFASWAVAMHLWFIPVYVVTVSLTPLVVAAHRRWGLAAPAAVALVAVAADAATVTGWAPALGWIDYLLPWLVVYQLGVAWRLGALRGVRPVLLAVAAGICLVLATSVGPYPVSMIGVPGQAIDNTAPPNVALLTFATAQAGVLVAVAPWVNRLLRRSVLRRVLASANGNVMVLYLWHMVAVIVVALAGYPTGLLPQPPVGSGPWWLSRLLWVGLLWTATAAVLAVVVAGRRVLAPRLPAVAIRLPRVWSVPVLLAGTGMVVAALSYLAIEGFAPDGHFPVVAVVLFAAGIGLVSVHPVGAAELAAPPAR